MENTKEKTARSKIFREWLQITVIVAATALGAYEFVLKDVIRPANRPTALGITASLEIVGQKDDNLQIRVKVEAKNPTDRRIYVPAFWYVVHGVHLYKTNPSYKADHRKLIESNADYTMLTTYSPVVEAEVVAQQRICYEGTAWWEPEDMTHNEALFVIPSGEYDYLEMRVTYFQSRDVSDLEIPEWIALEDGSWDVRIHLKGKADNAEAMEEWQMNSASGYNWFITTLPLW